MKRIVSLVLILALVFTFGAGSAFAAGSSAGSTTATVMKIAGFEGKVSITTEKGKDVNVSEGAKLLSGYTVKTGAASYCYISLDDAKALKLDQNTKVKIEKSGKKIEINVKSGQLFFDVDKKLSGNESMNIKTSNLTTGVRGTSGTVKVALEKVLSAMQRAGSQKSQLANMLMPKTSLQLFSGFTEVKAGAGKAVATGLSAGQQLAVNKTADSAGAGQTLVKGELVVDNFGARAIIENAAIKQGTSVAEALTSSVAQILEKVGETVLDTLNVSDSAKQQVTEMASDPQALDKAIAEQEQQETAKTEETMQAISEAKADAGSGNASSAASEQFFDNIEVSQSGTIDAGKVSFEGGSVTVEDTAAQTSGSHSGGSGSVVIPESGYLTGYTGAFNYFDYLEVLNGHQQSNIIFKEDPSVKCSESDIFIFKTVEEYTSFAAILADAKANYEEEKARAAAAGGSEPSYTSLVVYQYLMPTFARNYFNQGGSASYVMLASDSGDYPYYAIGHTAPYEEKTGTLHVRITKQELSVRWLCVGENGNETQAPESGTVFPSDLNGITDIKPEIGVVDDEGRFVRVDADIVGYDEDGNPLRISVGPGYGSGFDPAVNSGTMKVNSIEVPYFYAHPDEIIEPIGDPSGDPSGGIPYNPGGDPSGQIISVAEPAYVYETANFCLTGVYEYNYRIEPGWITGYTGTYDGQDHPAFNLTDDQANNYYIFCFDGSSSSERQKYRNIATSWSALRSEVNFDFNNAIEKLRSTANGGFGWNFYDPAGDYETVRSVSRTGRYLYYAIPKAGNYGDVKKGGTPVVIETADLYIGWGKYDRMTGEYTDVPSGSTLTLNDYGDIDVGPYTYMLGTGGAKVPVFLDSGYRLVTSNPVESAEGLYTVKVTGVSRASDKPGPNGSFLNITTPLTEGGSCPANDGNCNVIGSNLTFTYRLAAGNPITSQPILSSNIVGFADGYPRVACRADGFNITLKLAEAADTEVYGIFVGKGSNGTGYPDSYDVLHGHSNYVNQASALVYGRIDSADEETISIDFNEWQDADSGGFFAFILKQGNVISREPVFVAANSQFGGLYITGTENAQDTVAPRILSAFLNSARNKIVVEMSEDVAVPTNGEGFGFTGGTGTISSVSVSTVSALSGRTRYFMELGVENLEGVNMGLTYNGTAVAGTAVADTNGNPMAAITAENAIPIQDSAVTIDSVAASEDRSLIRVDLRGRLLDSTTNGTYMIKYGTSWDNSTQIQGSDMDWTDEFRWNDSHTQQLGTTFFHIDEDWLPSEVPEGRFFVRLNSGSKNRALETIEINSEVVESTGTLAATEEPSPSAVYDSSDATLTLTFEEGSMLEAGSSIVGGAVNCRFYIIDGDGKLFRLRGNYTDRYDHSLVFDNTGEYGMSGFGFDPDEVNWEDATLGYTREIHEDDVEYFDELLAADGTIITELTDIPITVVP